ncbi:MAG TPA: rhomboid family intramembrane serine protease [Thermoanaerobaculia bacterium]|nr:rhomboid family intramembrane serine protease [Thermoanaerobaculia bacterium]
MIPLRDNNPRRTVPFITVLLIVINVALGFFMFLREIPAVFILGFWFVIQFFTGVLSIGVRTEDQGGGVAYFAHIGGFLAGIVLVNLLGGKRRPQRLPGW